jgi:hypothetical protein
MAWQRTRSLILAGLLWSASALGQSHPATFAFPPQFSTGVAAGAYLGRPFQAVTADLNHDGYGDIVTADYVAGTVMVTLGSSTGFQRPMSFPAVANPVSLAVGDFNNDGNPDVVVVGSEAVLLLGTGTGSFQPPTVISPSLASFIAAGDFNGDGNLDVAIADDGSNEVLVALGNGNGTFGSLIATPAPYPGSLYAGDFRNNGLDDLIVVQKNGGRAGLLLRQQCRRHIPARPAHHEGRFGLGGCRYEC